MDNKNQMFSKKLQRRKQKVKKLRTGLLMVILLTAAFIITGTGFIVYGGRSGEENSHNRKTAGALVARAASEEAQQLEETDADESAEEASEEETVTGEAAAEETASNEMLTVYDMIELTGEEVFSDNILVDGMDVSGLTYGEAETLVSDNLNSKILSKVKLKISKDEYEYTFGDLGVSFPEQKVSDILKESIVYGNHGTLVTVYKEKATLDNEGKTFEIDFTVDENKVNQVITELSDSYTEQLPKNAQIHRRGGEFVIEEEVRGVGINVEDTTKAVIDSIENWENGDIEINAYVVETLPDVTAEDLSTIKDVLGSCKTRFSDSLAGGRGVNLKNGASKIDDVVLMPGESLSVHDRLSPFTVSNGYKTATAYANGTYVDSIGGGICQISTTLYGACLEAEIEVVKRSNHSMTVGYVDRAFDATVNDSGSKDLVIRNNYDTPIYIEAYLYNMQVCVYIYGKETRDPNRKVEYYSKVLQEVYPTEEEYEYIEVGPGHAQYSPENGRLNEELVGPDEILQIQGNYPSCKAQLYKKVTVNGKVVEETCLHTDKYRSSPAKFLVGANYIYPGKVVAPTEASTEISTETAAPDQTEAPSDTVTQPQTQAPAEVPATESLGE